ncbi:MAG: ACP S-malonyltransferase [Clostridia bacterium]|nr:ACP S-malonyltransferase [Clostridia bacterium]
MGKIGFVFAGQGAQYPGMGRELCDVSLAAARVFAEADALRAGTSEMCFSGDSETLMRTENTQPCMFAVELAAAAALNEAGIYADMTAGFSLGEIAALTYSGAVSFNTGFHLVSERGRLMGEAADGCHAVMAAVLKLSNDAVSELAGAYENVYPVNYNCPGQVSIAGDADEMERFALDVKAAGGRYMPLKVGGGFHSPYMKGAAEKFAGVLENVDIGEPKIPLYSNYTGKPYEGDARELLSRQICSPVYWERIIRGMISSGADTFVELGPGKTLSGIVKRIDGNVKIYNVDTREDLTRIER